MSLRDISYKSSYSKANNNIAEDFYLPSIKASCFYDRATGYFGSTIFLLAWGGLKQFVNNNGKMRIICSPYITTSDQEAICEGLKSRTDEELKDLLFKEFTEIFGKSVLSAPERVLACLISKNIIEIKIAVGKNDPNRLFHDKVGVFRDQSDAVAFRGSINETFKGLSDDGNFESFDVFTSWGDKNDKERLYNIQKDFELIWNNECPQIKTLSLPSSIKEVISKHARKESNWTTALDEVTASIDKAKIWSADKRGNGKKPRLHQLKALENWESNSRRGIFEHATGSGKTFTAICAIRKELELLHPILILVPSTGLLNQWKTELENTLNDMDDISYLLCGDGNVLWKQGSYLRSFSKRNVPLKRIILSTMGTASCDEFLSKIDPNPDLFVVADEVHNMGAPGNRKFFQYNAGARLGLSATPRRYGDSEGTNAIINYFDKILEPVYTLEDAIRDGHLCHYFYHPEIVSLTTGEQEEWDNLSKQISKEYAINKSNENNDISNRIKSLLINRARIVKNARNKVSLAIRVITENYKNGQKWIVYCDNQVQMQNVLIGLKKTSVGRIYQYHSEMSDKVRQETLDQFYDLGGIIVSIKCLDEGIDIPSTSHALILASSQNPREFIQRRGRILRKSEGKHFAYLFDAIVIPNNFSETDKHTRIIETELVRAINFGINSEDKKCITDLRLLAIDNSINISEIHNYGFENE